MTSVYEQAGNSLVSQNSSPVVPRLTRFSLYLIENQHGAHNDPRGSPAFLQLSDNDSLAKEEALR